MAPERIEVVESIRGVAAFMVLLSHLSLTFFPYLHSFSGKPIPGAHPVQEFIHHSPFGFFFSGTAGVYIFFVLSGYILTKVALRRNSVNYVCLMSLRRYPRLMIPSLMSCILAFFLFKFTNISSDSLTDWINRYGDFDYSFAEAFLSGAVGVFLLGESSYNPVLWTMQVELIGSAIIYLLCVARIRNMPSPSTVVLASLFLGCVVYGIGLGLFLGLLSFFVGYMFAIYGRIIANMFGLPLLIVGLYMAGVHNWSDSYKLITNVLGKNAYEVCNFLSGVVIVYVFVFNRFLSGVLVSRLTVFMGKVSFSAYLIHLPVISVVGVYVFNYVNASTGDYVFSALVSSVLVLIVTYIGSMFFYRYVDFPGMEISRFLSNKILGRGVESKVE